MSDTSAPLETLAAMVCSGLQIASNEVRLILLRSSKIVSTSEEKAREMPKPKLQTVQPHNPTETPSRLYQGPLMVEAMIWNGERFGVRLADLLSV